MTVFFTEKSIDGLCAALEFAFTQKIVPDSVAERSTPAKNFIDQNIIIENARIKTERVFKALKNYLGKSVGYVNICLLSSTESALDIAFKFAYKSLKTRNNLLPFLADKTVSDFLSTIKTVLNEKHRFTGFIRFKETKSGILYAQYSPDNDITELLCAHFNRRFYGTPYVIHDSKRKKAGVSNGKDFKIINAEGQATLNLSADETAWESLWKDYYNAVNIKERKNHRQQVSLMPLKYRKFLPETYEKP